MYVFQQEQCWSPFSQREWIEIPHSEYDDCHILGSPFSRREWIEIFFCLLWQARWQSPFSRREWIEILYRLSPWLPLFVSLLTKGVDWNNIPVILLSQLNRLPSHEGSGLKYSFRCINSGFPVSPFSRREWIEIAVMRPYGRSPKVSLLTKGVDWNTVSGKR